MRVVGLSLRDFRNYDEVRIALGEGLTVVCGPNGAGKTNLLEGLYFGCTGRSCRTNNERELVRFGTAAARVVVSAGDADERHELAVGFSPGQPKLMRLDGAPVDRLLDVDRRPLGRLEGSAVESDETIITRVWVGALVVPQTLCEYGSDICPSHPLVSMSSTRLYFLGF